MIAKDEIAPYTRLDKSMTDTRLDGSMTGGMECLSSYTVLVENSDRKRSTASLSSLACQVSAPTAIVTVNRRVNNFDRFCISQDSLRKSLSYSNSMYKERFSVLDTRSCYLLSELFLK